MSARMYMHTHTHTEHRLSSAWNTIASMQKPSTGCSSHRKVSSVTWEGCTLRSVRKWRRQISPFNLGVSHLQLDGSKSTPSFSPSLLTLVCHQMSLPSSHHSCHSKLERAGGAELYSACLACVRLWIWTPAAQNQTSNKHLWAGDRVNMTL